MTKKAQQLLKVTVSLGLLALILTQIDFYELWQPLKNFSVSFIVFSLIYYTGCQWLSCLRWQIILKATGYSVSMSILLSSYFAGMFLNTFLPGAIGGDVYRIYRVAQKTKNSEVSFVSVFMERVTGILALLGLAFMSLAPAFRLVGRWDIILILITCTAILSGVVLLIVSPPLLILAMPWLEKFNLHSVITRLQKIQILLRQLAQHQKLLMQTISLSFLLQLLIIYYYYVIAQQLKIPVSFWYLLVFVPIIVVATLFPISLGGLGIKEGLLAYLFSRVGLTLEQALVLSLTVTAFGIMLSVPGGLILLFDSVGRSQIKSKKQNEFYE